MLSHSTSESAKMTPDQVAKMVEDLPAPEYWLPHDQRVWRATVIRVAVEIRAAAVRGIGNDSVPA
jgi:hypothetical protein